LKMAYELLMSLDPKFTYFTIMSQTHVGYVMHGDRGSFEAAEKFKHVKWNNILVFDSRGMDGDNVVAFANYSRIPIPLLHYSGSDSLQAMPQKAPLVFFAGSCRSNPVRMHIGEQVPAGDGPSGKYYWDITECGWFPASYESTLQNSTWVIAPSGTMPVSFQMYEALQAGCLPIVPWSEMGLQTIGNHIGDYDKFIWLPYRDIGVKWQHGIAELLPDSELGSLRENIENISMEDVVRRQRMLEHIRPLFFPSGLHEYITYMVHVVNEFKPVWKDLGSEESALGRSTETRKKEVRDVAEIVGILQK